MEYRRLGHTGLKVSALSFGSWVTFGTQVDQGLALDLLQAARDGGVNFFDNAEAYGGGESERLMGAAIAELGWERKSYVVSTKLFFGIDDDAVNLSDTLNRKYLTQAIEGSLERFGLDFVDLLFCHRADPDTPIEETVWAMSDIVSSGQALYWGTSEWSPDEIRTAHAVAEKHHLHKPVVEQPQYNLFETGRVEEEYAPLYDDVGLGLTVWSPLASGLLTGKYLDGVPDGQPRRPGGLRVVAGHAHGRGADGQGPRPQGHRRRAGLLAGPDGHRLVHEEPPGLDGYPRGEPPLPARGEPGRPGGRRPPGRRGDGPHPTSGSLRLT